VKKHIYKSVFSKKKQCVVLFVKKITYLQNRFHFFVQLIVENVVASVGSRTHI